MAKILEIFDNFLDCKKIVNFLALFSFSALLAAYISQYVFGFQPCILCLYQRVPFFVIIGLAIILIMVKSPKIAELILILCIISLLANFFIASYHVGVEMKIFSGFSGCSGKSLNNLNDIDELRKALMKQPSVKCDEPQFYFLGLTMAAWNAIYCLFLAIIASFGYYTKIHP